jgi:hypothetical protein
MESANCGCVCHYGSRNLANKLSQRPRVHERRRPGSADGISGVGLHGGPITPNSLNGGEAPFPEFHDVYIKRENLLYYQHHGTFPDGTVLVKELVLAQKGKYPDGSLDSASGRGYFPSELHGIDVMVKDSKRFANTNKWGFFTFGHQAPPYSPIAKAMSAAQCASCHIAGVAKTDMVWVQYYPLLRAKLQ